MFKNYLIVAWRNIARYRGYALINMAGLAIGMACCLCIGLFVHHERNYDGYHQDADRCYRLVVDIRTQTANRFFAPISPTAGPALLENFPQVEAAARIWPRRGRLIKVGEKAFYEDRFLLADASILRVLSIPFLKGRPEGSLDRPLTVLITRRAALKYFGREDALGAALNINGRDYEVTGVVADCPENTHLKYDFIASLKELERWRGMSNWHSTMFFTYFKLKPRVDADAFALQVENLADRYVGDILRQWGSVYHYEMQPLADIHLHSHLRYEIEPAGNPQYIRIFLAVGIFILLIAAINFMNLSTARAAKRSREVGLRKVVGARRKQLIGQFLGESLLMVLLALLLAVGLCALAFPALNRLAGTALAFDALLRPGIVSAVLGFACLTGLAAGLYPALVLSGFRPAASLKGGWSRGTRGVLFRRVLVVGQFAISITLIIGTLIVARQLKYMKNRPLGFDKVQKLVIPVRGGISLARNYEDVKTRFRGIPGVTAAAVSSSVPGRGVSNFAVSLPEMPDNRSQSMFHIYFDADFIPQYGIEVIAGRSFRREMSTDVAGAFLINQSALAAFGWSTPEEALGQRMNTGYGGRINPIIGVVRDFHYRGLQTVVEPLVMEFLPETFDSLTLTVDTSNLTRLRAALESTWRELYPSNPFEMFFLDDDFDRQYRADEQVGRIFMIFTALGLFIACLGLLGLAAYTAEQRTKEIGIRKVLGASAGGIVTLLSREFIRWVLAANLIAWPAAYLAMSRWLENFAYRSALAWWVFLVSTGAALFIALLTVSLQSIRAALADPVDSLRYE